MPSKVIINIVGQDDVSEKLKTIRKEFDNTGAAVKKTADSPGWQSVVMGAGMGIGMAAWNELGGSVSTVVGFLGDTVQAEMDNEASIKILDTAIADNVKAWDGNRDSIEKVIRKREDLGFSDVEQRKSLALLVTKTGDVSQALDIERTAMDLARLKGIDLATASGAIAKGMSGQGRALIDLGINVKEYTDKASVLYAIQDKTAGQAVTFAETTAGALAGMNAQIDEAKESIGAQLTPYIKDLAIFIRDNAVPAIGALGDALGVLRSVVDPTGQSIVVAQKAAHDQAVSMLEAEAAANRLIDGERGAATFTAALAEASATAQQKLDDYAKAEERDRDWAIKVRDELPKLGQAFADAADKARANRLDEAWGIAELPSKIILAKAEVAAAQKELEDARTKEQKAAATIRLLEAEKELEDLRTKLRDSKTGMGAAGALIGEALGSGLYNAVVDWNTKTRAEIASLGGAAYRPPTSGSDNRNIDTKATGGPVSGGYPYLVGERGPELFVPGSSGSIEPSNAIGGGLTLSPGSIIVNGAGDPEAVARSVMLALKREQQRQGMSYA